MSTIEDPPALVYRAVLDAVHHLLPRRPWADRLWLGMRFRVHHGRAPTRAMRYNDYLFRHLVSDAMQGDLVVRTTCKSAVKDYLAGHIAPEHIVPTIAVLRSAAEVDGFDFPDDCVIKGTAGSGQVILRRGGAPVNRRILKRWLRRSHYYYVREPNYAPLKNAVIVEPILGGAGLMDDLKCICWQGRARWLYYNALEKSGKTRRLFDTDWNVLPVGKKFPLSDFVVDRPPRLAEMVAAAERVAAAFDYVRVDFYFSGDDWWIGELTHCDSAAASGFIPLEGEALINQMTFGEAAYDGPLEAHGAMGARG